MSPRSSARSSFVFYSAGRYLWLVLGAFLVGAILLGAAGVWGLAKVAEWIVPAAGRLAAAGLGVFLAVVLPLSLVKNWRSGLAGLTHGLAAGFSLGVWMVSFLTLWKWVGFFSAPLILIPFLAPPLAILRLAFQSDWNQAAGIAAAVILAQGMRRYAFWLRPRPVFRFGGASAAGPSADVIDTEVVERSDERPRELP